MEWQHLYLLFFILFLPLASAEVQILPHPVKTHSCVNLPQIYANSTFQNITTIQRPDESVLTIQSSMTSNGGGYFNYTFCNTTQNGEYIVNGIGDIDGTSTTWNYQFTVNPLGMVFTAQQATLYTLIFVIAMVLFLICVGFGIYAPDSNKRDEMTGYIFAVSNLKYVKMFLLAISYLLLMLIVYFGYIISYGYLDLDFLGSLFQFAFYTLVVLILPLFIIGTYLLISNMVHDHKIGEMLSRGLHVK